MGAKVREGGQWREGRDKRLEGRLGERREI